jgi:hypothetical protein
MRLHIQPFTPAVLPAIVPASAIHLVENLSYHEIQTFPDNNYGYLELPAMEAEKLKKKLNGAILKGKKMKIEEARPRKRRHEEEEADVPAIESIKASIESTARKPKRKRDLEVIRGHSIPPGRIVKRGWTDAKEEKTTRSKKEKPSRIPSRYTEKDELLFQTKVPANKKDLVKEDRKKNGKKRNANGDVVHEFEKTEAQPSFLRNASSKGKSAIEYVDGKGWLDENGEVVEEGPAIGIRVPATIGSRATRSSMTKKESSEESGLSSHNESTPRPVQEGQRSATPPPEQSDETSSSGSSSSDAESDSERSIAVSSQVSSGKEDRTSSPNPNASIHPLEALFKKPSNPASQDIAKPSLEIQTSFSFFNQDGDDLEDGVVPGTPFNSQDNRSRGHRSAAPTPDTAHPSRYNSYSSQLGGSDEDEDEDEHPATRSQKSMPTPSKPSTLEVPQEQSAFEKQFWENRGELGRGWKRRRREVQKEKRQRENRANKRSW